eukprot:SAG22_NODE_22_length_31438_cov_47.016529_8_plen_183_part_00
MPGRAVAWPIVSQETLPAAVGGAAGAGDLSPPPPPAPQSGAMPTASARARPLVPRVKLPPISNFSRASALRERLANSPGRGGMGMDTPHGITGAAAVPDTPRGPRGGSPAARRPGPLRSHRRHVMAPVQSSALNVQPRPPPAPEPFMMKPAPRAICSPRSRYSPRLGSPARWAGPGRTGPGR